MIFQEKFCSKKTSLILVGRDGFQAGEDRHGMLGFYLGARDEEERPPRSCRGTGSKTTAKKKHHCWRKPFQCLDQCFTFHVAFRSCLKNLRLSLLSAFEVSGSYRCAP